MLWIDYLIHIQNSVGDTRIGLVFSEDEKNPPYGDRQNPVIKTISTTFRSLFSQLPTPDRNVLIFFGMSYFD